MKISFALNKWTVPLSTETYVKIMGYNCTLKKNIYLNAVIWNSLCVVCKKGPDISCIQPIQVMTPDEMMTITL